MNHAYCPECRQFVAEKYTMDGACLNCGHKLWQESVSPSDEALIKAAEHFQRMVPFTHSLETKSVVDELLNMVKEPLPEILAKMKR